MINVFGPVKPPYEVVASAGPSNTLADAAGSIMQLDDNSTPPELDTSRSSDSSIDISTPSNPERA